jgi:hypothetical protein
VAALLVRTDEVRVPSSAALEGAGRDTKDLEIRSGRNVMVAGCFTSADGSAEHLEDIDNSRHFSVPFSVEGNMISNHMHE